MQITQAKLGSGVPPMVKRPKASALTIYNSIPLPLPPSLPSQNFQALRCNEFGDQILLGGTGRLLSTVTVGMVTWAYATKYPGILDPNGWTHSITLNLYAVNPDASPGALLGTVTQDFAIPWRPEPSPDRCTATPAWYSLIDGCHMGAAFTITFDLTALDLTLPDQVIFGIAFNTESAGFSPIGVNGPYDDLAVGLNSKGASIGSNPTLPEAYVNGMIGDSYADGGEAGIGIFRLDVKSTRPTIAIEFDAGDAVNPPEPPTGEGDLTDTQQNAILREAVNYYIRNGPSRDQGIRWTCEAFIAALDDAARENAGTAPPATGGQT